LFVATIPQSEAATWWKPSLSRAPGQYKSRLVLLLASDLGPDAQDRLGSFRKTVEAVPGATLEYNERVAFVYRLPVE
jgi:hypothetical protein